METITAYAGRLSKVAYLLGGLGARVSGMSANAQKITKNYPNQDLEKLLCRVQKNFCPVQFGIVDLGQRNFDDALDGLELIDLKGGKI